MVKQQPTPEVPVSTKPSYVNAMVGQMLLRSPIFGTLDVILGCPEKHLVIGLGVNAINGRIYEKDGKPVSSIGCFSVANQLQRRGIGQRLLKAYIAESKVNGALQLWSGNVSSMALKLRAKVLGSNALQFYDSDHLEYGLLPMTLEQAMLTNARIDEIDEVDLGRLADESYIGVYVDLESINTSSWELPQLLTVRTPYLEESYIRRPGMSPKS